MAIMRRKLFEDAESARTDSPELLDSPDKLTAFATSKGISMLPLDVTRLAESLDLQIAYSRLDNDVSGILYREMATGNWQITVNRLHHIHRQRYTIAHEIAHYCLHRHMRDSFEDEIYFRGGDISKMEYEANDFAGAILMPEISLKEALRDGVDDVESLANLFKVSTLALRFRAKSLGMTGHGV